MLSLTNYQPWKVSHVVKQLLHDAGQAFIKSESDEKLRQALWHQVRTSSEVKYENMLMGIKCIISEEQTAIRRDQPQ